MALRITKDLKVKCIAVKKWLPEHINPKEWYLVIGVNSWQYKDSEGKVRSVLKFIVINDVLQITQIAEFNCQVLDKEAVQTDFDNIEVPKRNETDEEESPF